MDAQLMARGFEQGLMGIEELSSYDLVQVNKKKTGKVTKVEDSKVISKKRPLVLAPLTNPNSESDEPPKKKKTRQKRKPKQKKKKVNSDFTNDSETSPSNEKKSAISETLPFGLPGWKDFNVPQPVLRALKDLKFEEPTPIQRETMPAALDGHADIVGAAETGSGKTLAFGIPIIHGILADRENDDDREKTEDITEQDEDEVDTSENDVIDEE